MPAKVQKPASCARVTSDLLITCIQVRPYMPCGIIMGNYKDGFYVQGWSNAILEPVPYRENE